MQPASKQSLRKRSILSRVERDDETMVHEDENAHLWAVSYSDFLMALLAFFILFFSIDPPHRNKLILNLAQEFSKGPGTSADNSPDKNEISRLPATVLKDLVHLNITVDKETNHLLVNFPDDIYNPGQHTVRPERKNVLEKFLQVLKPYDTKIKIYFEGHADAKPLRRHKNYIVTDNFVLSSLRANTALSMARTDGFSDKYMFIQAASSNHRNSRSLSIRIEALDGDTL